MKILKKAFRYRLTAVFFIVGQLVIYFAVFGALTIYNKAYYKERDRINSIYENRVESDVFNMDKTDIFSDAGQDISNGNIILAGKLTVGITELGAANICEVILKENEIMPYDMVLGHLPGELETDYGKNVIALGRDKYKYAYEQNGKKYITVESEVYEVVGVIGCKNSNYMDYKVVLNINCMGENTLDKICSQKNYKIELSSNNYDVVDSYNILYKNIMNISPNVSITSKKVFSTNESIINETLGKENLKVNMIVCGFCFLNCMVMSEFWIIQRRKEIAIKKSFGIGNVRLLSEIAGNVLALSLCSLVIALIVYTAIQVSPIEIGINIVLNWYTCITVVGTIIITILFTMIYPIYKILKTKEIDIIGKDVT